MFLTKISAMQTTLLNFINKPKKLNLRFLASFLLIGCLFSVNLNAQTRTGAYLLMPVQIKQLIAHL